MESQGGTDNATLLGVSKNYRKIIHLQIDENGNLDMDKFYSLNNNVSLLETILTSALEKDISNSYTGTPSENEAEAVSTVISNSDAESKIKTSLGLPSNASLNKNYLVKDDEDLNVAVANMSITSMVNIVDNNTTQSYDDTIANLSNYLVNNDVSGNVFEDTVNIESTLENTLINSSDADSLKSYTVKAQTLIDNISAGTETTSGSTDTLSKLEDLKELLHIQLIMMLQVKT